MGLCKTIYSGAFIHCDSVTKLDICPDGRIGVDESGKIAFVQRGSAYHSMPLNEGWEQAKVVRLSDHGFFFPGFIGWPVNPSTLQYNLTPCLWGRYSYSRLTISQCWYFRKVNVVGLA